jgi:hypothetical protein
VWQNFSILPHIGFASQRQKDIHEIQEVTDPDIPTSIAKTVLPPTKNMIEKKTTGSITTARSASYLTHHSIRNLIVTVPRNGSIMFQKLDVIQEARRSFFGLCLPGSCSSSFTPHALSSGPQGTDMPGESSL